METNVNVTVPADYNGTPVVVHLLSGGAPKVINPVAFKMSGDITTPRIYLNGQKPPSTCSVVMFDRENMCIGVTVDYMNENGSKVTGKVENSEMVTRYAINQDKKFTLDELRKLVRLTGPWFKDENQHRALMINLNTFNAKVEAQIADEKNNRGSENKQLKRDVTTDVPFSFVLQGPILKGGKSLSFQVDVCLEITDGGVRFWLESTELIKLSTQCIDEMFDAEQAAIEALGYTCITVS